MPDPIAMVAPARSPIGERMARATEMTHAENAKPLELGSFSRDFNVSSFVAGRDLPVYLFNFARLSLGVSI